MNKNKILLVDDEFNLRETITELLTYQNYDVKTATNGQEALDLLEHWMPDLIICDIMMPVMDGNTLYQIIKETQSLNPIPFIFLTAKKELNLERNSLLDGVDAFISKPFKIKELIVTIENKIERFEKIKNTYNNLYTGKKRSFLHEINTPLSGILGSIELLINYHENLDKKEVLNLYKSIKISGDRLNRTMQNIILYQNFKNNTLDFSDESQSEISNIFSNVKESLVPIYDNKEKLINFEIEKANIKISNENLYFILFELIDNSLKFSPANKIVMISGVRLNEKFYELIIRDFGIGFNEHELKKIGAAKQFNREEREQQGLGLGLFLSKIIIKKSKGVFTIISKENEGTTIKIFLPLCKNANLN